MTMLASQITSLTVVYSIVYSGVNQRKHQSSASLAFVREIHRGPVNFPHKWPVTRKMFPFDDVIMKRNALFPEYETALLPYGTSHYSNGTLASWRLKLTATGLFVQEIDQDNITHKIKAPYHCPFVKGIHRWRVVSLTREQKCGKHFHVMTSSYNVRIGEMHQFVECRVLKLYITHRIRLSFRFASFPCGHVRTLAPEAGISSRDK